MLRTFKVPEIVSIPYKGKEVLLAQMRQSGSPISVSIPYKGKEALVTLVTLSVILVGFQFHIRVRKK